MAYGTEAGVTFLIGGTDTEFFTSANIAIAIASADVFVDLINTDASAARKTEASNLIAESFMKNGRVNRQLKGMSSDGGTTGRPARTASRWDLIPKEVYSILGGQQRLRTSFSRVTPNELGEV